MMWLEMSRDETHGGSGWAFGECLWSPSHKDPRGKWPFWESLLDVKRGDTVVHLRGQSHRSAFVGFSLADTDGYETSRRPTIAKRYQYATSFYRVPLTDYTPFLDPIVLDVAFARNHDRLLAYLDENKLRPQVDREHLFFVLQARRLQCLNGAYLSMFSERLAGILLGRDLSDSPAESELAFASARTGQQLAQIHARVGQKAFSENVRSNFGHICCFPGCDVRDDAFLVGSHIARWSDAPELRGDSSNGLCLCLMHDRAFELGLFTLTVDGRVRVNASRASEFDWAKEVLLPYEGRRIRAGTIAPSEAALEQHWNRIGFRPIDG